MHRRDVVPAERSALQRFAAIAGRFGVAASPDLTILSVALAASTIRLAAVLGTLVSFTVVTLGTFAAAPTAPPKVFPELTDREGEIVQLIARGRTNEDIARALV